MLSGGRSRHGEPSQDVYIEIYTHTHVDVWRLVVSRLQSIWSEEFSGFF